MTYRHWSSAERELLLQLKGEGWTRRAISERLGRTWRAVKHQLETWRHD